MFLDQALVAEDGDARNGMHILLVQEVDQLGNVVDVNFVLSEKRVVKMDVDATIGILDVENDGIAANFAPMADDSKAVIACRHDSGQVDGAHLEILGNGDGLFSDGCGKDPRNNDGFVRLEDVGRVG